MNETLMNDLINLIPFQTSMSVTQTRGDVSTHAPTLMVLLNVPATTVINSEKTKGNALVISK